MLFAAIALTFFFIGVVVFALSMAKVAGDADRTIERWGREREEGKL